MSSTGTKTRVTASELKAASTLGKQDLRSTRSSGGIGYDATAVAPAVHVRVHTTPYSTFFFSRTGLLDLYVPSLVELELVAVLVVDA
jgi:hypothetical protein